jgi:hypothetical protein
MRFAVVCLISGAVALASCGEAPTPDEAPAAKAPVAQTAASAPDDDAAPQAAPAAAHAHADWAG